MCYSVDSLLISSMEPTVEDDVNEYIAAPTTEEIRSEKKLFCIFLDFTVADSHDSYFLSMYNNYILNLF